MATYKDVIEKATPAERKEIYAMRERAKEQEVKESAKRKFEQLTPLPQRITKTIAQNIPNFRQGSATSLIQQKKTVPFGTQYTRQQNALKQLFGGGEKIWALGEPVIKSRGLLRSGAGPTRWDERRETANLFFK
jgi:hypothetical protein